MNRIHYGFQKEEEGDLLTYQISKWITGVFVEQSLFLPGSAKKDVRMNHLAFVLNRDILIFANKFQSTKSPKLFDYFCFILLKFCDRHVLNNQADWHKVRNCGSSALRMRMRMGPASQLEAFFTGWGWPHRMRLASPDETDPTFDWSRKSLIWALLTNITNHVYSLVYNITLSPFQHLTWYLPSYSLFAPWLYLFNMSILPLFQILQSFILVFLNL